MTKKALMPQIRIKIGQKLHALLSRDVAIFWENMPAGDLSAGQGYAKLAIQPASHDHLEPLGQHTVMAGQLSLTIGTPTGSGTVVLDRLIDTLRNALAFQSISFIQLAQMHSDPFYVQNGFHCVDCQFEFIAWESQS